MTVATADANLEAVFAHAPIGMALVSPDGRWLKVNEALCALVGRSEAELLASALDEVAHPDDLATDAERVRRLLAGEIDAFQSETRCVRPSGAHVWVALSVAVVRRTDGAPEHYIVQAVDIDEPRRTAAILARREREYRHLAEQSTDLLSRHGADGTVLFASAATRALLGYEPEELLGTDHRALVHPDDVRELDAACGALAAGADVARVEARVRRRDGRWTWVETSLRALRDPVTGAVVEAQANTRDVSDRRRLEERHRTLIETMAEGVLLLGPDGRVRTANVAAARMLGRSARRLEGATAAELSLALTDAEGVPLAADALPHLRTLADGTPCENVVLGVDLGDGDRRWASLNARAVLDEAGAAAGAVVSFIEITDLVRAEAAAEQRAADLERSNRDLEHFAYIASHDLSEPLRVMATYAGMLERRYADVLDERGRRWTGAIVEGGERMRALIDDLLAYSRVRTRALAKQRFPAGEALDTVLGDLSRALADAGAIVTRDALPEVEADHGRFCQVLQNLLANAIKFGAAGREPAIHVGVADAGREWAFTVADNGIGIEPEYHDRIFALFQRLHTSDEHPGTGLGLAICKEIVDVHGGRLSIESEPGEGSRFTFTLPKAAR